jgi:hypothetical protein
MLNRRTFLAAAAVLPVACKAQELPTGRGPTVSPEDMGWTSETSPADTAGIINAALEKAITDGITYYDNARRRVAGTIRIHGQALLDLGAHHEWEADYSDPSLFTAFHRAKRVFVDVAGARGTIVRGPLSLTGSRPRNMTLAGRARIPADLVAITSSAPEPSSEMTFEAVTISGFGHALYQGRQERPKILPYTRWSVRQAQFRFCLQPIVTGAASNGLDDAMFDVLRLSRNVGVNVIRGTDLNASSLFCHGLDPVHDVEPGSLSLTAGDATAHLPDTQPGTVIAALGGGNPGLFVSEVVETDGETVRFAEAPETDFAGRYAVNPPSFLLANSSLNAVHAYFEGIHDEPVRLENGGKLSVMDLKISGGTFAARRGYAVHGKGEVDVGENPRTEGNRWIKGLVAD